MSLRYSEKDAYNTYNSKIKIRKDGTIVVTSYDKYVNRKKDGFIDSTELDDFNKETIILTDDFLMKEDKLSYCREKLEEQHKSIGRVSSSDNLIDDTEKEIRADSLTRSRNLLIDYACQNYDMFKSFITLTYKENVTDINKANKDFYIWVKQITRACKKNGNEFYYLCVPEYQKRGAVHYHLLTSLVPGSDLITYQMNTKGLDKLYDVKYWNHGFTSAFDVINDTDDNFNIALYLVKYFYKDIDNRLFGHTKVMHSRNLEKPNQLFLNTDNIKHLQAINYVKEKYDIQSTFRVEPNENRPYAIPSTIDKYTFNKEDYNTVIDTIKGIK